LDRRIVAALIALGVISAVWFGIVRLPEERPFAPDPAGGRGRAEGSPADVAPAAPSQVPVRVRGVVLGAAGSPLHGALVTAGAAGLEVGSCSTDAAGRFSLDLSPGAHELRVSAAGHVAARVGVVVPPDRAPELAPIALEPAVPADGRVVTAEGDPIAGATVVAVPAVAAPGDSLEERLRKLASELRVPDPARRVLTATSAADGTFRLDGLARGAGYRVIASAVDRRPIEREHWMPGAPLELALPASPWVPVRVRGPDGERPPLVTVRILAESGGTLLAALERGLAPEILSATGGADLDPRVPDRADFPLRLEAEADGYLPHATADLRELGSPIEIILERGSALVATVRDAVGRPVPGATLTAWESGGADPIVRTGRSDGDGSCTVGPFRSTALSYLVEHPTHLVEGGSASASTPLSIVLAEGVALAGVVRAITGEPLSGARVSSSRSVRVLPPGRTAAPVAATVTGDDGSFRLPGLSPASDPVTVSAGADGFASISVEAALRSPLELLLSPTVPLSARVVDAQGTAIPACPAIVRAASGVAARYLETDDDGALLVADLAPGDYRLDVTPPDHPPVSTETVSVRAGDVPPHIDVRLPAGGDLDASVVDEFGQPLAGVTCTFIRAGERVFSRTSDFAGRIRARGLPTGELIAELASPGRDPSFEIVVLREGDDRRVEWVLAARRGIIVRVRDPLGAPVIGASVVAVDPRTGERRRLAVGPDGQVEVRDVGADAVDLLVEATGWGSVLLRNQFASAGPLDVVLRATGAISGVVVDRAGEAIPRYSVQVMARVGDDARPVRPAQPVHSAQGEFVIDGLAEGVYDVTVGAPGRGSHIERGVRVRSGEIATLGRIGLVEGGIIAGSVLDARSGAAVPDAIVEVVHPEDFEPALPGTPAGATRGSRSRADGGFSIGELRDGWVEIEVRHPAFRTLRLEVRVGARDLALRLDPGGGIAGILTDAESRPIAGAVIRLASPGVDKQAVTDLEGRFALGGLDEGEYELTLVEIRGRDPDVVEREEGPYRQVVGVPEDGTTEIRWETDLELSFP